MDMWSLGCIFGELLQRMERTGASFTPNLAIMPVFQFSTWSPNTPDLGISLRDTDDALAGRVRRMSPHCPVRDSSTPLSVCCNLHAYRSADVPCGPHGIVRRCCSWLLCVWHLRVTLYKRRTHAPLSPPVV